MIARAVHVAVRAVATLARRPTCGRIGGTPVD